MSAVEAGGRPAFRKHTEDVAIYQIPSRFGMHTAYVEVAPADSVMFCFMCFLCRNNEVFVSIRLEFAGKASAFLAQ